MNEWHGTEYRSKVDRWEHLEVGGVASRGHGALKQREASLRVSRQRDSSAA
jgi:hypothetical protein